jgi:hypothetical protein
MELCKEGRFNNMNETTSSIGITDIYMCPIPDYNITLWVMVWVIINF